MPSAEPYRLVIWRKVLSAEELQHEDVVRIAGTGEDFRFSVRRRREASETFRLREIINESEDDFETGSNVFFNASVRFLAEQGLLLKRLYADVNDYDVWATQDQAWSRRRDGWLPLVGASLGVDTNIPEDARLVWRLVPSQEVSF